MAGHAFSLAKCVEKSASWCCPTVDMVFVVLGFRPWSLRLGKMAQIQSIRPARLLFPTNLLGLCSPGDTTGGMRGGQTEGTGKVTLFLDVLA